MTHGLTPSEKFVTQLCEKSFLKLWTHPNPKGKKDKELCDCLIVCGPHIVIISVKENEYKDTGDKTGWERWTKSAIEKSASQIWGAERWLESSTEVIRHDGRVITLPPKNDRNYHRISVSLGANRQIPLSWGDLGNGFIHVCDEDSVRVLFGALDTITDFVEFLTASENLVSKGTLLLFDGGGIEDLFGLYLSNGRSFDIGDENNQASAMFILQDDVWKGISISDEFKEMLDDLKDSYIWDRLIEDFSNDLLTDGMFDMFSQDVSQDELALVTMALQPRAYRAVLAENFMEFLKNPELKVAARFVQGHNHTAFVFLAGSSTDRESRSKELMLRCLVIRGIAPDVTTVVGIATDRPGTSEIGYSSDIAYLHMTEWTPEHAEKVKEIQNELGYFARAQWENSSQSKPVD